MVVEPTKKLAAWKSFLVYSPVAAVISVSSVFFYFLLPTDYIYDDIEFLSFNPDLTRIKTFWDCFLFQFQFSKPVSNFFLALGHWLTNGDVVGQRIVSLFVHAMVVFFIWLHIRKFGKAVFGNEIEWVCALFALLFAINPIHCETLSVVQFRGEMLGTLFALVSLWISSKILMECASKRGCVSYYALLLISIGLSILSKEIFAVVLPLSLLLSSKSLGWNRRTKDAAFFRLFVLLAGTIWGSVLIGLASYDVGSLYSYNGKIGRDVLPIRDHLVLSARAVIEGIYKISTGIGLTSLRLSERSGIAQNIGVTTALATISGVLVVGSYLWKVRGWMRVGSFSCLFGLTLYLFIPNLNIGSEHYWYFPSVGILILFGYVIWILVAGLSQNRVLIMSLVVMGFSLFWGHRIYARLWETRTRVAYYLKDVEAHPEVPVVWAGLVGALLDTQGARALPKALPYLETARKIWPDHKSILSAEFMFRCFAGQLEQADLILEKLSRYNWLPRQLARMHLDLGVVAIRNKRCDRARKAVHSAILLDRNTPGYQSVSRNILKACP